MIVGMCFLLSFGLKLSGWLGSSVGILEGLRMPYKVQVELVRVGSLVCRVCIV